MISSPSAWTPSIVHDFTDSPSTRTVQAPHERRVAADVRPGQAEALPQDVDEELARLDLQLPPRAVDGEGDALSR